MLLPYSYSLFILLPRSCGSSLSSAIASIVLEVLEESANSRHTGGLTVGRGLWIAVIRRYEFARKTNGCMQGSTGSALVRRRVCLISFPMRAASMLTRQNRRRNREVGCRRMVLEQIMVNVILSALQTRRVSRGFPTAQMYKMHCLVGLHLFEISTTWIQWYVAWHCVLVVDLFLYILIGFSAVSGAEAPQSHERIYRGNEPRKDGCPNAVSRAAARC